MPWGLKHFQQSGQLHFLDLQLLSTPVKLRDSAFPWMLRIVTGTRAPVLRAVRVRLCRDARTRTSAGQRTGTRLFSTDAAVAEAVGGTNSRLASRGIILASALLRLRRSLGFARDFGSGLGRPLNASASTCGARANLWKSYATSIATQSCADWWSGPRTGAGAASVTISTVLTEWSRSNPNGQHGAAKNWGSCRQLAFTKTPAQAKLERGTLKSRLEV